MKSTEHDPWKTVSALVEARFMTLSMSKAEFSKLSGVSNHTLNAVLAGEPIQRADKRGDLSAGLGWTRDSIDRILAGGEPVLATPRGGVVEDGRLDAIDDRLDRIEGLLEQLVDDSRAAS